MGFPIGEGRVFRMFQANHAKKFRPGNCIPTMSYGFRGVCCRTARSVGIQGKYLDCRRRSPAFQGRTPSKAVDLVASAANSHDQPQDTNPWGVSPSPHWRVPVIERWFLARLHQRFPWGTTGAVAEFGSGLFEEHRGAEQVGSC